ncbi:unnamed protein product [Pelagomonas calceolata]|uniref:Uncharacterized protein n=1 Tax=Pelagomonas calceolata TaxID=35677 RepID=A0A8J2SFD6_9STRA|nr:unnamed protein product [Pelagomonas calceolata]
MSINKNKYSYRLPRRRRRRRGRTRRRRRRAGRPPPPLLLASLLLLLTFPLLLLLLPPLLPLALVAPYVLDERPERRRFLAWPLRKRHRHGVLARDARRLQIHVARRGQGTFSIARPVAVGFTSPALHRLHLEAHGQPQTLRGRILQEVARGLVLGEVGNRVLGPLLFFRLVGVGALEDEFVRRVGRRAGLHYPTRVAPHGTATRAWLRTARLRALSPALRVGWVECCEASSLPFCSLIAPLAPVRLRQRRCAQAALARRTNAPLGLRPRSIASGM